MRAAMLLSAWFVFTACGGLPSYASNTFENDADGWVLSGNGEGTTVTLMREGGNPGGHICGKDAKDGDVWSFVAPAKYLGNLSSTYGKRLIFDLKQSNIYNQVRGRDVVLNGGGLAVVFNLRTAPGTDWTPYSVRLDDMSNWQLDDAAMPASESDLRTVLSNLTSLRIRGEYYDGPLDTTCLDNVYLGTP